MKTDLTFRILCYSKRNIHFWTFIYIHFILFKYFNQDSAYILDLWPQPIQYTSHQHWKARTINKNNYNWFFIGQWSVTLILTYEHHWYAGPLSSLRIMPNTEGVSVSVWVFGMQAICNVEDATSKEVTRGRVFLSPLCPQFISQINVLQWRRRWNCARGM